MERHRYYAHARPRREHIIISIYHTKSLAIFILPEKHPSGGFKGGGRGGGPPTLLAQTFFFEKPPFFVFSSLRAFAIMTTGLTDCLLRFSKLLNSPVDTPSINGRGLPDWATHRLHEYFLLKPLVAETSDSYQYILHAYGSL